MDMHYIQDRNILSGDLIHNTMINKRDSDWQKVDAKVMGSENRKSVFQIVQSCQPISRTEITGKVDLSKTTVSSVVDQLLGKGLLQESKDQSYEEVGRKPRLLRINPDDMHFLVIDLGGTNIRFATINLSGKPLQEKVIKTPDGWKTVMETVLSYINQLGKWSQIEKEQLAAISLAVPGVVSEEGVVSWAPNIEKDKSFPLKDELEGEITCPIFLENDVNLAAIGEYREYSTDYSNLVYIAIGTGVGAGLIINGDLYVGSSYEAGEIGWMISNKNVLYGEKAEKKRYCEKQISGSGLIKKVQSFIKNGKIDESVFENPREVTTKDIFSKREKSKAIEGLIKNWIAEVATVICAISSIINPGLIVFGGGLSEPLKEYTVELKELVNQSTQRPPKIKFSEHKERAPIYGGAKVCFDYIRDIL